MKNLLILSALLLSSIAFFAFKNDRHIPIFDYSLIVNKVDTFPNKAIVSNASTMYKIIGGETAGIGSFTTNYIDTASANLTPIKDYSGAQIFVADTLYIRNVNKTKWVAVLSNTTPLPFNDSIYVKPPLYVIVDSLGRRIIAIHMQDGLVSGGIVTWSGQGLIFNISPAVYVIGGNYYASPATRDTLSPADPDNPRYDLFVVDTSNRAGHITGEAAPSPTVPQPEIGFQLALTNGLIINPGDTVPSNILLTVIYNENVEWSIGYGSLTMDANNTNVPYRDVKDIFVSKYNTNSRIGFTAPGTQTIQNGEVLSIPIYLNGKLPNSNGFTVQLANGSTNITNEIFVSSSTYGFNRNDSNAYQIINVPFSAFTFIGNPTGFNILYWKNVGYDTSGAKGYYLDYLTLQSGIPNIPPAGNYTDSAGTYKINDSTFVTKTCKNGICKVVGDTIHIHSGSGGGSTLISNIGSGYRLAVPFTNEIKTIFSGNSGATIDSTTNANALTIILSGNLLNGVDTTADGNYLTFTRLDGTVDTVGIKGTDTTSLSNRIDAKQNQLNGTGFIKVSGTTITYVPLISLTTEVTNTLPVANGGTNNSSLSMTNGNLFYADGSKFVSLGIGTSGQTLHGGTVPIWKDTTVGGGGGTISGAGTSKKITFWNGTSSLSGNTNIWVDSTNSRIGFNTSAPLAKIHIQNDGIGILNKDSSGMFYGNNTLSTATQNQNSPAWVQSARYWTIQDNRIQYHSITGSSSYLSLNGHFWGFSTDSGATYKDSLVLTRAGWLGVLGGSIPLSPLSVGQSYTSASVGVGNFGASNSVNFITIGGRSYFGFGASSNAVVQSIGTTNNIDFKINSTFDASGSTLMRIQGKGVNGVGSIGIGTTTPCFGCAIDVVNTIRGSRTVPVMTQAQRDGIQGISSITIGGSKTVNYSSTVSVSGGGGSGAIIAAVLSSGTVTGFTITDPGSGFTSVPTITVASGSGQTFTAVLGTNAVDGMHVYCTDCTATNGSTGVEQVYQSSTSLWKNLW